MAYDSARGQTVFFGADGDTQVWDGAKWTHKNPVNSPSSRSFSTMTYDAANGVVVLFGGRSNSLDLLNDTWIWNGTDWIQKNPANRPPPRFAHSMTYDSARTQVVLFGGNVSGSGSVANDTWVWNGVDWTLKSPVSSPPARGYHALTYDAARGQVVLFGGYLSNTWMDDTWVWDGAVWTLKVPAKSPPPRAHHAMAYDATRGLVVLFSGAWSGYYYGDTWVWDGMAWTMRSLLNTPSARIHHSMTYDATRGEVVMFGGYLGGGYGGFWESYGANDTWVWDGIGWIQRSPAISPSTRFHHSMAYDRARRQTVLFGGVFVAGYYMNDTWVWGETGWIQRSPAISPSARIWHSMAYDATRDQVVLFGGSGGSYLNDTWAWDGTNWIKKNPATSPPARGNHSIAYDAMRGQVILFGGFGSSGRLSDTWAWDGTNWTQKSPLTSPPARRSHSIAYDAVRGQVIMFGGSGNSGDFSDTWIWDGTNWTQKSPSTSPTARSGHSLAYDAVRGQVILFGGAGNSSRLNDTWAWDGTNWTRENTADTPPGRQAHAMAYDTALAQMVLFGGNGMQESTFGLRDTWVWNGGLMPCSSTLSQSSLNVSATAYSGFVTVTSSASNCGWTATAQGGSWLQITSGTSGTGMGQIGFKVAANTGTESRTAMIKVGGSVFAVTQEGVATAGTPFPLSATPRCWEGSTSFPAGPGVLLSWEAMGWPAKYEILRDREVISTVTGNQYYNITGLAPGKTYVYQVTASSASSSLPSAQVAVVAPSGCSTTSSLRVEEITLGKALLVGGESTQDNKLRLSGVAPAGGTVVTLSSSSGYVTVPATVTVPAGQSSAKFQLSTMSVQSFTVGAITATLGTSTRSVTVELKPAPNSGTGVAYLLLHGLNSSPDTWKDLVDDRFDHCDRLKIVNTNNYLYPYQAQFDGQLGIGWLRGTIGFHKPSNGCYVLGFGSAGEWENGDGLNYFQLGQQVEAAVEFIWDQRKPTAIVFVGHSRGGLAARAFLQNLNSSTLYKKGLVTIGTPHRGSPFGRIKLWMDQEGYTWTDTAPPSVLQEFVKFVYSPSTGYMATSHDADGTLNLSLNPELNSLLQGVGPLSSSVAAAGQIVSTGLKLGENGFGPFDLFGWSGVLTSPLPGSRTELRDYVFQNIESGPAAGWSTDTDGIVPVASQKMDLAVPGLNIPSGASRVLTSVHHVNETSQTDCINNVLDAVIGDTSMHMSEPPESQTEVRQLSERTIIGSTAQDSSHRLDQAEVVAARSRLLWLNECELVERAIKGSRLNSLEGLLSRQEIRQRGGESQRELVTQIERRLQSGESEDRVRAARLLAEVPAEHSAVALIGLVRDERDPEVRLSAMKALRSLAQDTAMLDGRMLLSQELGDLAGGSLESDPAALMAAVDGLVALGAAQDVEGLMNLYSRAEQGHRKLIVARMGELRNGEGARRLAAYLEEDPDVLQEETRLAGEVLSEVSTVESVSGLLAWAKDLTSEPLEADAVRWLGKIRSTRGKARLSEAVNQEMFRSEELRQRLTQLLSSDAQCACAPAVKPQ